MDIVAGEVKVAVAGILSVALISLATYALSSLFPASPAIYFFLRAFVLIPLVLVIVGALAAREAYFACLGPNRSIALAVIVSLVSAVGGIGLWLLAGATVSPDYTAGYFNGADSRGLVETWPLLVVYALAGSIGGVYDYYISRGRKCEVRPGKGM